MVCTDGVHVVGKGSVPRCEGCAGKQARVPGVQEPKAVAGCAAGHDVHVAVGVTLYPVSIAKKSFQKGTDASTELNQMDGLALGQLGARNVAQGGKGCWC